MANDLKVFDEAQAMKTVFIHQTLHGYSEGHRLLDGSLKLSDENSRLILRLSDLSGSNMSSGFEDYVTAYPLPNISYYALAKTWYAAEMPRPGCVWTHTLLVPEEILNSLPFLGVLLGLFNRPKNFASPGAYTKPIEFDLNKSRAQAHNSNRLSFENISSVLWNLYGLNKGALLIGAQNSRDFEHAIFNTWSQQWPSLRKSFSFCTGALSARGFAGKPFDIQCTPLNLVNEVLSGSNAKFPGGMTLLDQSVTANAVWLQTAAEDAMSDEGNDFRAVLWEIANDEDKLSFARFAEVITIMLSKNSLPLTGLFELVAATFPTRESGVRLKKSLFGNRPLKGTRSTFDEKEVLAIVGSSEHYDSFDAVQLRLKQRSSELCMTDPQAAKCLLATLFRSSVNPHGEEILAGMISSINPALARDFAIENQQFLPTLFRAKPELAASAELWSVAGDRKRELFEAVIVGEKLNDELVRKIVQALLESDSEFLVKRALESWGKPAVFGTFDWIANRDGVLSERTVGGLTFHVKSIVEWLVAEPSRPNSAVVVAAHVVAPYSYEVKEFRTDVWEKTYREISRSGREKESLYFAAFLLALGFQNAPPSPLNLISECFEPVYQAAWNDKLPDEAWVILDALVPHLWWIQDWDKCERLRRGLVEVFVKNHWPATKLAICVPTQSILERVVASADRVSGGSEMLSAPEN